MGYLTSDLLRQARALNINLSQSLESELAGLAAEERRKSWKAEDREAIAEYNDRIAQDGVFGGRARHRESP